MQQEQVQPICSTRMKRTHQEEAERSSEVRSRVSDRGIVGLVQEVLVAVLVVV